MTTRKTLRTLTASLVAAVGIGLLAPAAATAAPTGANGSGPLITTDRLKVWNGEEQGTFQNGDEPVVVTLMIRTTLGVKGSTRTAWVSDKPRELGSGVDNGDWVTVPDDQGDAHFTAAKQALEGGTMAVKHISQADLEQAYDTKTPLRPDLVMTVTFAFDGDFSGQKTLMAFMDTLRTMMVAKMNPVFASADLPSDFTQLPKKVEEITAKAKKVTVGVWDVLLNVDSIWSYVWKSGGDYDDLIGASVVGYVPVERDFLDALPFEPQDVGLTDDWSRSLKPRPVIGDGWIEVPTQVGFLARDAKDAHLTHVVQSDLPIEDHVGYDLQHFVGANR